MKPVVDAITVEVISQSLAGIVLQMPGSLSCTGSLTIRVVETRGEAEV